jgi:glycine cleavage system H lipoate-binding protein
MFPWVYDFKWTAGHLIFVGLFLSVAAVVAVTLLVAAWRAWRDLRTGRVEIVWRSRFHDLPPQDRECRHSLTGERKGRVCELGFDCRQCDAHAKLIALQSAPAAAPAAEAFGLSVPPDRLYHRGHTWIRTLDDGQLEIGLDDMARRLLGPADRVSTPEVGSLLTANVRAFELERRGAAVEVLAPVDGIVTQVAPAGADWLVRVEPAPGFENTHLLRGAEVEAWYRRELERLQALVFTPEGEPALADGGVLEQDAAAKSGARWDSVCGQFLLDS